MRRRTKLAVVAGGATATIAGGAVLRSRLGARSSMALPPDDGAIFTVAAPGGEYAFWNNGPVGWLMAKAMPRMEAGLYETVAQMLELQPDDDLLDSRQPSAERTGRFGWSEAEFREIIGDAGFIEPAIRYQDVSFRGNSLAGNRIVACRKPSSSLRAAANGPAPAAIGANAEEAATVEAITVD